MTDQLHNSRADRADHAMDQRLRTHAGQWRANLPEPGRDLDSAKTNPSQAPVPDKILPGQRHSMFPLMAAAAVLIAVIISIAVINWPGHTTAIPPARQPSGQPSDNPTGRQPGILTGVVVMTGGPHGTPNTKVTSGTVRAMRNDGHTQTAEINKNATYTLTPPPGNYHIRAKSPQWNGGTSFGCQHDAIVHIRPSQTTTATIQCQRR